MIGLMIQVAKMIALVLCAIILSTVTVTTTVQAFFFVCPPTFAQIVGRFVYVVFMWIGAFIIMKFFLSKAVK